MERLEQLELEKSIIESQINDLQNKIDRFEIESDDYEEQYNDLLNESGLVYIGGIEFDPSDILKKLDPIAYRCGLLDYINSIVDYREDQKYNQLTIEMEELENELSNYENEIEKLKFA